MGKGKLPDGYRGVDKIIEEFRSKNPKGKIETQPVLLGDGYVIITAKVTSDDGAIGSGMADADVQEDKAVEKAESGAVRRALLTLGYKSVETDDAGEEEEKEERPRREEKSEKKSFKRDEPKDDDEEDDEEEEEKPKSRFGNKGSSKKEDRKSDKDSDDDDEPKEEGESKFKRGSRFQRN